MAVVGWLNQEDQKCLLILGLLIRENQTLTKSKNKKVMGYRTARGNPVHVYSLLPRTFCPQNALLAFTDRSGLRSMRVRWIGFPSLKDCVCVMGLKYTFILLNPQQNFIPVNVFNM